jgi:hypothetical protein
VEPLYYMVSSVVVTISSNLYHIVNNSKVNIIIYGLMVTSNLSSQEPSVHANNSMPFSPIVLPP